MHPFFNAKDLDDDAINKKILELQRRLMYTNAFGANPEMMDQFYSLLEALEFERQERAAIQMNKMFNQQFPDVIESDPDFKSTKTEVTIDGTPKVEKPKVQPVFTKTYKK